ncbi:MULTISPECIES: helix-turn-helix transcriptional regulator [unclassified Sphingobium]|uniref:helix-turn-helix transcriptional regulator n=1 Tax=unclassified Sphingobium TaxID=2611147 RepID=UPI0007F40BF9|nr:MULTISPECIES: helix-turn-helix transcriptional regulator [unclassified Sphingobium]OAN59353.1 AraC family transcriptional regulator [Sphingobium sp. TCM1]WIW90134.1 helix-turn-helix transcriptional regulator [Sphingobium sp. V4]
MPPLETYADSTFEAELVVSSAKVRIMRLHLAQPTDRLFRRADHYWLDLCLTPRPEKARGCYRERWGPHRYEPLGEIFLVPPGEGIHIRSESGGRQASVVCEIPAVTIDRWLDGGIEWTDRRLAAGLDIAHPHMRACLLRLAEEVRHPGPGGDMLAELIAQQLAIEVARYCQAIAEGPITGGLASWRLRRLDERLHQPGPPPPLEELAALCNMSVRQLTRGFRASRGCSIGDHVAQIRIDMAKRHLGTGESVKEIAFALGFASPSSFAYAFRRATGATPRQFRQRRLPKAG